MENSERRMENGEMEKHPKLDEAIAEIKRVIRDDMEVFYDDVYLILKNKERDIYES